jgi:hypothetical protein
MKMSEWQNCGTLGIAINTVAEPTVDATFRKISVFDESSGLNRVTVDLPNNNMTVTDAGRYDVSMFVKFAGSNKNFEFAIFVNGIETQIKIDDKLQESTSVRAILDLPAGAIVDMRQRSTDGGITLTVYTAGITLSRLF